MVHRSYLFLVAALLAICAFLDGLYLSLVHLDLELGQGGVSTVCHKLAEAGCSVTAGRFGDLAGIPVAIIGSASALLTAITAMLAWFRRTHQVEANRVLLWGLACISLGVSGLMAAFSLIEGSFCPFCVLWYGLNIGLFVCSYLALDSFDNDRKPSSVLASFVGPSGIRTIIIGLLLLAVLAWSYFSYRSTLLQQRALFMHEHARQLQLGGRLAVTWPEEMARQGGPSPDTQIYEFSDFQCPHCRRLWNNIKELQKRSSRDIEVGFINYPLDAACNRNIRGPAHEYACLAAQAAECARKQGKFWTYADLLFANQGALDRDHLLDYAKRLEIETEAFSKCMDAEDTMAKIQSDIELGEKIRVRGTPTYFIDGYRMRNIMPAPLLDALIEELLEDRP